MPDLDVSELLSDPDFAEFLTVERRTEMVGANGRARKVPTIITPKPVGVVLPVDTAIGGNAMERNPDEQHRGAALEIHTRFRLRGPAPGGEPDVIIRDGNRFVVTIVNDYSRFGRGFMKIECSSMESIDEEPE